MEQELPTSSEKPDFSEAPASTESLTQKLTEMADNVDEFTDGEVYDFFMNNHQGNSFFIRAGIDILVPRRPEVVESLRGNKEPSGQSSTSPTEAE